jgi:hypothetical protein
MLISQIYNCSAQIASAKLLGLYIYCVFTGSLYFYHLIIYRAGKTS